MSSVLAGEASTMIRVLSRTGSFGYVQSILSCNGTDIVEQDRVVPGVGGHRARVMIPVNSLVRRVYTDRQLRACLSKRSYGGGPRLNPGKALTKGGSSMGWRLAVRIGPPRNLRWLRNACGGGRQSSVGRGIWAYFLLILSAVLAPFRCAESDEYPSFPHSSILILLRAIYTAAPLDFSTPSGTPLGRGHARILKFLQPPAAWPFGHTTTYVQVMTTPCSGSLLSHVRASF
ncbi:hypothetical protein MSAN_01997000 [Mycena sanguinolenta]|uniref:Uncharacterized protein n=1 Tax=Mycena sanguinolenta TaxID=230812 RepID=A0A8H6XKR2_9AGAR|nr:hypothetical protein MSAN_01997000 [Mycena sanguinolenta]